MSFYFGFYSPCISAKHEDHKEQRFGKGTLFECSVGAVLQEAEMVCVACNGKGYVIEKHRESVCSECQGRGECFFIDRDRDHKKEALEVL